MWPNFEQQFIIEFFLLLHYSHSSPQISLFWDAHQVRAPCDNWFVFENAKDSNVLIFDFQSIRCKKVALYSNLALTKTNGRR